MGRSMTKAERLQQMIWLYLQRSYTDIQMADRLGVDRTTVYRDRLELSIEQAFIKEPGGRYRLDRMQYLPNIKVNLHEALALNLAARRASRQTRFSRSHTASAFEKFSIAFKQPMAGRLTRSSSGILNQHSDPQRIHVFEAVTQDWAESPKVQLAYRTLHSPRPYNHLVHPYLIEPSLRTDGFYLIGYSETRKGLTTFKNDCIEGLTF